MPNVEPSAQINLASPGPVRMLALHGKAMSILLELREGAPPIWRHWGRRLQDPGTPNRWADTVPVPSFSLDINQPLTLVPVFGRGWMGPTGLSVHRSGQDWAPAFTQCQVKADERSIICDLHDPVGAIRLTQTLTLDARTDVLSLQAKLTNTGSGVLDVAFLAAGMLPLPDLARTVESFSGRHNNELQPMAQPLSRASWRRENRRGLTSHDCPPMACVLGQGADNRSGPVWSAQLAWSGNHCQQIDWHDDGSWIWMAGEWLAPGEMRLEAGASLVSPQWLATFSPDGRDGAAANFHGALRARSPLWAQGTLAPRKVHLNTWEGFYFDHDEADLKDLAVAAAQLGIERFVLDDGWFKGRTDDTRALGDWVPDLRKYPQGLGPLAAHVNALGMEFGLWVEPEMINPDSDLYRAHPDWVLRLGDEGLLTARNQLVLDLGQPDVRSYLFGMLAGLLRGLPIAYLKWDHNRDLTQAGAGGRAAYHRQILGVYDLIDQLRAGFPGVEIESCAGGGGRIDAGILSRTHRVWTSDCIDAVSRMQMQQGFLQYFPPEVMGAHVGASPSHSTGRSQSMAFRASVALPGHFGVELDPRRLLPQEQAELASWIGFYKQMRGPFHHGQIWRGQAGDGVTWQAHGDERAFVLFIWRLEPTSQRFPPPVRLPFLGAQGHWRLARIDPGLGRNEGAGNAQFAQLEAGRLELTGEWLAQIGLNLPHLKAQTCLIIRAERVGAG